MVYFLVRRALRIWPFYLLELNDEEKLYEAQMLNAQRNFNHPKFLKLMNVYVYVPMAI